MISEAFQQHIPLTNVMYPVNPPAKMPAAYGRLLQPVKVLKLEDAEVNRQRKAWVQEWLQAMTQ